MLLRQFTLPILELAVAYGFVSASHFSRSYRSRFGYAPRAEREHSARPSAVRRRARAPLKRRRGRS
jgi:transcriptional regulator GlxA family with amidase domain